MSAGINMITSTSGNAHALSAFCAGILLIAAGTLAVSLRYRSELIWRYAEDNFQKDKEETKQYLLNPIREEPPKLKKLEDHLTGAIADFINHSTEAAGVIKMILLTTSFALIG
jgi:hypothetical protein